jgi:acyl-CoA reductase-like NAD-dependent aldehyde dehydrogenase
MAPVEFPAYVAGSFRFTSHKKELGAPFDGAPFAIVNECGPAELDEALAAGARAFAETRALSSYDRASICREVAAGLTARAAEVADGMVTESGKPIGDAEAEVQRAIHCFEIAAAEAERLYGDVIPLDLRPSSVGRIGLTRRFPVGLVVGIAPFNFPLNLAVHKVAPALAAGCPIVLKPAEQTPTSCLRLAEIIDATRWPKGALSVVPADRTIADRLVTDERPALLSFTGSQRVGWDLKARAGKKKVVLELGGNAAVIVDESADLDAAIPKLIYGAFSYAGQKCISVQRLYVHARRFDEFTERFVEATRKLGLGDPRDRNNLVGPMIDEANARRIEAWVAEACGLGARVLVGGERRGTVVPPTVLTGVPRTAKLAAEEAFGPTVNLERIASFDEGIAQVNDSRFGLQCGVFTRDLAHTFRAFEQITVGAVIVNDAPSYRIDHMPYGGVKDSGLGREGIRYALRDYTEERLLVLAMPAEPPVAPPPRTS